MCTIKTPRRIRTSRREHYRITAYENSGAGFRKAPCTARAPTPEIIFFR
jgi:hypothetical protein